MIQNKNIDINHHVEGQRPRCPQTMNDISTWWSLKVICGLLLVANQAAYFAFGLPAPIISIPIILSQVLVISGAVIFFTHFIILKRANPLLNRPGRLVQNKGLFRWIRHPMYLGEILLDIGLASFCFNPLSILVLVAALIVLVKQALHEDHLLSDRFGMPFENWAHHSSLIFPLPSIRK